YGDKTGCERRALLGLGQATLWAYEHDHTFLRSWQIGNPQTGCGSEQHTRRAAVEVAEKRLQDHGRIDLRNAIAAALLAGGDGDRLPMQPLALRLPGIEPHDTALGQNRHDPGDAELRSLLHD